MKIRVFEITTVFAEPLEKVFEFFCDATNLDRITPKWLNFRILTEIPIEMKLGSVIDYRLKLFGIPVRWRTAITRWEPPGRFEDTQLKGPYSHWIHLHEFTRIDRGVRMLDRVEYTAPGWFFEPVVNAVFVSRNLRRIFEHRKKVFSQLFNVIE